jgi:hypothetical protein
MVNFADYSKDELLAIIQKQQEELKNEEILDFDILTGGFLASLLTKKVLKYEKR